MFFRPSFCAHCGERIERAEWRIWTSRRFCPVCESEFKGQDLIPRVVVGLGVIAGIFGFGSYLRSGSVSDLRAARQPQRFVEKRPAEVPAANSLEPVTQTSQVAEPVKPVMPDAQNPALPAPEAPVSQSYLKPKVEQAEPVYYCGAETKKGTPCSRRVKGNTRCYQHVGMPAMIGADKLRLK